MRTISPVRTGFVLGAVFALWHLMWVTLVAVGWASAVLNFILRLHFLSLNMTILPFNLMDALGLVIVTAVIGFVIGAIFAAIWNWLVLPAPSAVGYDRRQATA